MADRTAARRSSSTHGGSRSSHRGVGLASPSNRAAVWLIVLGLVFHVVYVITIVDVYFRSPLVQGMAPTPTYDEHTQHQVPARRLVLIVADGLRADTLYERFELDAKRSFNATASDWERRAELVARDRWFLRDVARDVGQWGVSHSRVPTESRPGHVAMIAGFYEDVSAVTKGWKMNPVEFDSVFNQSREAWGWGSPDIVPMFAANVPHMNALTYDSSFEDFAEDAWQLDQWVFEHVDSLFDAAEHDAALRARMQADHVVYFLHLLGLDTNGHAHRPYSKQYHDNIHRVDTSVALLAQRFERFFNDNATAFVFTADHGMSNKGSHGDGEPANTETPFIVWGAGIAPPSPAAAAACSSDATKLCPPRRIDIEQADLCPLMAALIGANIPMNSVGVLPAKVLAAPERTKASLLFNNAKQILAQLYRKSDLKQQSSMFFRPFGPHASGEIRERIADIEASIANGKFELAMLQSTELINVALAGMSFFQTYDWQLLISVVLLAFVGWMAFTLLIILQSYTAVGRQFATSTPSLQFVGTTSAMMALVAAYLYLQSSPLQYYLYAAFPLLFWAMVLREMPLWLALFRSVAHLGRRRMLLAVLLVLVTLALLEVLVLSYFYRAILSVCLLLVALWFCVSLAASARSVVFLVACVVLAVFPTLSTEFGDTLWLVCTGGILFFVLMAGVLVYISTRPDTPPLPRAGKILFAIQFCAILASVWLVYDSTTKREQGLGLPAFNQSASWMLFGSFLVVPLVAPTFDLYRIVSIFLAAAVPYILLSIHYEVLYLCSMACVLVLWLLLEGDKASDAPLKYGLRISHLRTALIYLLFCYVSLFGTGHIASISSFEISSTYRFTTVFDPFLMSAIVFIKLIIPFILSCVVFTAIHRRAGAPEIGAYLLVIAMSDVLTINFFLLVSDSGSWQAIGTSISHYAISDLYIVTQLALFAISQTFLWRAKPPTSIVHSKLT